MQNYTDYRTNNILKIYRNDSFAGNLIRTENGCIFEFDKEFLSNNKYNYLTFNTNKYRTKISLTGYNLPPFYANLLPEGLRLKAIIKHLKTSEDDMFTLFAASGDSVIGDVHASNEIIQKQEYKAPKLSEVNFYDLFSQSISKIIPTWEGNETIAGIQEKLSASMITFPVNIASNKSSYILKLNPKTHENLVENEFYIMKLASLCGLNTAKVKLVRDRDKNYGLLVTRFDKEFVGDRFISHHQEDGCQILDRYPADKYRISLNEIAKKILELASAPQKAILSLLQLYCFSYLVGNGDLHAKNISLIQRTSSSFIELTPVYDLICTYIYGDRKMAIKIDGRDDNITSKTIIDFAQRHGIPESATKQMLSKLSYKFQKNIDILFKINTTEKNKSLLRRTLLKRLDDLKV